LRGKIKSLILFWIPSLHQTNAPDSKQERSKRVDRLSPDGLWHSCPKVPNLLQYVKSGVFYGRLKVDGKLILRSMALNKDEGPVSFTTAKLRLADFVKKHRATKAVGGTFGQARKLAKLTWHPIIRFQQTPNGIGATASRGCLKAARGWTPSRSKKSRHRIARLGLRCFPTRWRRTPAFEPAPRMFQGLLRR
jgi:hypothetical protein